MGNFPGGRNQAKKVYGYTRFPKREFFFVENGITQSFDSQSLMYHRDFFYVVQNDLTKVGTGTTPTPSGEYDEDFITFSGGTSLTKTFNITFSSTPIVVLEIMPTNDLDGVNVFLISTSTTSLTVGTSAPFSGTIRYRAIYAPVYPVTVQRNVVSASYSYTATAGYFDVSAQNFFTASYVSLGSIPSQAWFTPYDVLGTSGADVAVVASSSYGLTTTSVNIASETTDRFNFLFVS